MTEKFAIRSELPVIETPRATHKGYTVLQRLVTPFLAILTLWHIGAYDMLTRLTPSQDPFNWTPCGNSFECGRFQVPLDYNNVTVGNASLSVARFLATNSTRLGSLFLNPGECHSHNYLYHSILKACCTLGGPGVGGIGFLYRVAPVLSEALDGQYDIVQLHLSSECVNVCSHVTNRLQRSHGIQGSRAENNRATGTY